jgi:hypothetical protein
MPAALASLPARNPKATAYNINLTAVKVREKLRTVEAVVGCNDDDGLAEEHGVFDRRAKVRVAGIANIPAPMKILHHCVPWAPRQRLCRDRAAHVGTGGRTGLSMQWQQGLPMAVLHTQHAW